VTNRIGWTLQCFQFLIKQGSAGKYRVVLTVLQADSSPLPSYDGWTASLKLAAPNDSKVAISIAPSVVGDSVAHTLTVDLVFDEALTENAPRGLLKGDLFLTQPVSGDRYCPANIELTIEKSFS
jgi:hypothetical protein